MHSEHSQDFRHINVETDVPVIGSPSEYGRAKDVIANFLRAIPHPKMGFELLMAAFGLHCINICTVAPRKFPSYMAGIFCHISKIIFSILSSNGR